MPVIQPRIRIAGTAFVERFVHAPGPGGQNVDKVATAPFHVVGVRRPRENTVRSVIERIRAVNRDLDG